MLLLELSREGRMMLVSDNLFLMRLLLASVGVFDFSEVLEKNGRGDFEALFLVGTYTPNLLSFFCFFANLE